MRWLSLVLLAGCETSEVRAWAARRAELEQRGDALIDLEQRRPTGHLSALREALDLPGYVRAQGVPARVFVEPGATRLIASGTVQQCRDTVAALSQVRWLTQDWRLRLESGRCEWEARTGADAVALESASTLPPPKWSPPPSEVLSRGVDALKEAARALEEDVQARETRLGPLLVLEGRAERVQPMVESLRGRPAPCDLAVLDRELALDAADQGKLLEVEQSKLVHPLEPRTDFRLRGLVEVHDGALAWRCEAL